MTSTLTSAGGAAAADPRPAAASPRPSVTRRATFGGVVKSERIKLFSLRSIKLTLGITVLFGIGLSALVAIVFSGELRDAATGGGMGFLTTDDAGLRSYLMLVATVATPFLALIFGVLGVFSISSEYSSGMILSTLAAVPKRWPVFFAKGLVLALVAGVAAIVLTAGGLAAAVLCYPDAAPQLANGMVISGALGAVAYLVLTALLAFGVAALLRSTAGGIAVIAGLVFVLPIAFELLSMTGWEWVSELARFLPSQLGQVMGAGISESTTSAAVDPAMGESTGPDPLTFWGAFAAMGAWVVVFVAPAAVLFARRDAK
ncbi:ABC transporter permease subunit [Leucobacter sp. USHLN153]|uniref:ABC transporter permease subunit n=1 Tax=Leucobacter sp. USHLN153 TaxID=3081268 RepID=UPI003016DF30